MTNDLGKDCTHPKASTQFLCSTCAGTGKYPLFQENNNLLLNELKSRSFGHHSVIRVGGCPGLAFDSAPAVIALPAIDKVDSWKMVHPTNQWVTVEGWLEQIAGKTPTNCAKLMDPSLQREVSGVQMSMFAHGLFYVPPEYTPVTRVVVDKHTSEYASNFIKIIPYLEDLASKQKNGSADVRVAFWVL